MVTKIVDYLQQLDISEIEAKLYLTLLETGAATVREIAQKIDIKRTTAYIYIDQLIDKGLIMKEVKGSRQLIVANEPSSSLQHLIETKVQAVEGLQNEFPYILRTLNEAHTKLKRTVEADIKYYKGKLNVKKIYDEALNAEELCSYVNISIMSKTFPENSVLFAEALKKNKKIKIFEILENSLASKEQAEFQANNANHERYFYKFLPKGVTLSATDILIYDGKVAIINVRNQITGVVLQNIDYHNSSKELFNLIWRVLPDV